MPKLSTDTDKTSFSDKVDRENDWEYQASSPDEKALVEACRRFVHCRNCFRPKKGIQFIILLQFFP